MTPLPEYIGQLPKEPLQENIRDWATAQMQFERSRFQGYFLLIGQYSVKALLTAFQGVIGYIFAAPQKVFLLTRQ
jgi:hypothetical protein